VKYDRLKNLTSVFSFSFLGLTDSDVACTVENVIVKEPKNKCTVE